MENKQIIGEFSDEKTEIMYQCSCNGETVSIEQWKDSPEIYLSIWFRGFTYPLTWKQRIRYCWQILRNRKPYGDQIVFTPEVAKHLGEKLIELSNKDNARKTTHP